MPSNAVPLGEKSWGRRVLDSAALASGAEQVVDFVLPLFAGAHLGLSPGQTGVLVAVEQLVAFLARPVAAAVVDRADRSTVAGVGAAAWAVGCGLYALSTGLLLAACAALVTGAAGAFVWIGIRAIVGERLRVDSGAFAELMAAEEAGGWIVLVPAVVLVPVVGCQWVFAGVAACCVLASWNLLSGRCEGGARMGASSPVAASVREERREAAVSLRPMLVAVAVTMSAESAIGLLLILHLQRGFELEITQIAYVFLPGAVMMSVLPPYLHRLVVALGRRRALALGSTLSAVFALALALAPSPLWIGAAWVLSATAWSLVVPVQQSAITESVGPERLGRGLGMYEASCLVGQFVGSAAAGFLYGKGSWMLACVVCAAVIASGGLLVPLALGRLGVADRPAPRPRRSRPDRSSEQLGPTSAEPDEGAPAAGGGGRTRPKSRTTILSEFLWHTGIFGAARLVVWALPNVLGVELAPAVQVGIRVWTTAYVIDIIWTAWELLDSSE